MTGWFPRCRSDEFNTLILLRRSGKFYLRVTDNQELVAQIPLDHVTSYVIKVPTWHEVKQAANTPLIALHLSKGPNFDHFYDLLVSSLKVLQKYDRLASRVGADEKTFLDELKIVRIRMERMAVRHHSPVDPEPPLPPPPPPPKPTSEHRPTTCPPPLPPRQVSTSQRDVRYVPSPTSTLSRGENTDRMELVKNDENGYYVVVPTVPSWVCSRCTLINKGDVYHCGVCEKTREDAWRCRRCSNLSSRDRLRCTNNECRMLRCPHCEFHNDPSNEKCDVCNNFIIVQKIVGGPK